MMFEEEQVFAQSAVIRSNKAEQRKSGLAALRARRQQISRTALGILWQPASSAPMFRHSPRHILPARGAGHAIIQRFDGRCTENAHRGKS
jgi:hypothetical protein